MSLLGKRWIIKNTSNEKKLLEKVMQNRDLDDAEKITTFFSETEEFLDPYLMKDMEKAVARIKKAISDKERIIIYGDYDVDGITGTTILVKTLNRLGAQTSYRIPHRFDDGYGLHDKYVDEVAAIGAKLIITVDCGISCAKQITHAKQLGLDVIVTDHHTIPEVFPSDAYAILHPLQVDCPYPFKGLTGSAVAFKLAHALLSTLSPDDHLKFLESLTDLASFGTVADCGPLTGENRTIVKRGLKAFKNTHWAGLRQMKNLAKIKDEDVLDTTTIGFKMGPRINAAGRVDHPYVALQLLLRDEDDARTLGLAQKLEGLNIMRQDMTQKAVFEAMKLYKPEYHKHLFIAHSPDWHTGILGLIASRAVEKFGCPAIILQERGDMLVASARSIDGCNITELIGSQAENLITFGGHSAAAGFSVKKEKLHIVEREFYKKAQKLWGTAAGGFTPALNLDCEILHNELTTENAMKIEKMQPFGIGNTKPLFVLKDARISDISLVGKEHNHARLTIQTKDQDLVGIFFSAPEKVLRRQIGDINTPVSIACNLELNRFRGKTSLQLMIVDIEVSH
ncbi:MAG: single-stranded-DNA-specific exonuclease RecJ [Candidatus Peregrinibacteria bacterium]|nr:single-stranded-DNA-specific exonuclease RecJ [Candidatus Peregrinibacteria bacterium]